MGFGNSLKLPSDLDFNFYSALNLKSAMGVVNVKGFGAKGDGVTDDTQAIQNAINAICNGAGEILFFPAGVYKITDTLVFPESGGYIKNIRIEGASSGLATGGTIQPYGTRIDFYGTGILFDLSTNNAICVNVQFRNIECYDRVGTSETTALKAYAFQTGCILENIGFKNFYHNIDITNKCYYAKFDRVSSFYTRHIAWTLNQSNNTLILRPQFSKCYYAICLSDEAQMIREVTIIGGWFENIDTYAIATYCPVTTRAGQTINIIGCYFESSKSSNYADIKIDGPNAEHPFIGGNIIGNRWAGTDTYTPINFSYATHINVMGNYINAYYNDRCIYSANCAKCAFINNYYDPDADKPLSVPEDNIIFEPDLGLQTPRAFMVGVLKEGLMYWDTTSHVLKVYDGTAWKTVAWV